MTAMPIDGGTLQMLRVPRSYFQGVRVDNIDGETALEIVRRLVAHRDHGPARSVVFTNVHSIHLTRKDSELLRCINESDLVLPDGSGLAIAGRILGRPIVENLNGTDFTPRVLAEAESNRWSVFLLGAKPEVLERCRQRLVEIHPLLRITGTHHGHFPESEEETIVQEINRQEPAVVLVALGSPLQEKWISRNAPRLNAAVCLGVGGLFDFLSGERERAPLWMRRFGIEWVYRFTQDPVTKWRRVTIEIPLFLAHVFAERFFPWLVRHPGLAGEWRDQARD
jgi:exopolysaccharide biosynthesis WecB/TagA/CpsF family protein